ncbi:hypothetical protein [Cytobacillus purgationiresistens]|uniref:Uncharacterized protein n=1 Tax=Cytobacillus purgationiresistens TaxID=863449 RepID=A0ABU0AQ13_9BACI|nr:hypothetical protein [Cytobacillus purgationiresistens]MDQ0272976.1 hypothetical protein [Cytobacillus purgationiresistens]MDQ0273374.1 hypothetical protein [Cytobacillus purgationiresistens]
MMTLKDFLNEEEIREFEELQVELLSAHNTKERIKIQAEIDVLLSTARYRYEAFQNEESEAATYELIKRPSPYVRLRTKKEAVH